MTFTSNIKNEITKDFNNNPDDLITLLVYLKFNSTISSNQISICTENPSVARWIFKLLKRFYNVEIKLTARIIKRFKKRNLYILDVFDKVNIINKDIENTFLNIENASDEEKIAFLKGIFLSCGSINDPKKNKYHMEFVIKEEECALLINNLLTYLDFNSKILKRDRNYMVYIKKGDNIADFINMIGARDALFYFEDIRIYKDHTNMVNRLNNCEQANVEKTLKSSRIILDNIKYLEDNELTMLFDDRVKEIISYKKKNPDTSLEELAKIISMETSKSITKSGINHIFRKINDVVNKHKII